MNDEGQDGRERRVDTAPWPAPLASRLEARIRLGRDNSYPVPIELEELLRAIHEHGSIVKGFERLRISHQSALALIRRWEGITGHALVIQRSGVGSELTPFGRRLLQARTWLDARLARTFEAMAADLDRFLDVGADPIRQRVVLCASHDLALERLHVFVKPRLDVALQTAGSLSSLRALKQGECDIAGFHLPRPPHLLGPLLGEFAELLNPREHAVVRMFGRQQGFMLRADTRHRIRSVRDVVRHGMRIVNREKGAGTRTLFDALLAREMIDPSDVLGYEHEVLSHTDLARAIRGGEADAAFGIEAAARSQRLRFVPVVAEAYYLACRRSDEASIALDTLAACLRSDAFSAMIERIGGYDLTDCGQPVRLADLFATPSEGAWIDKSLPR